MKFSLIRNSSGSIVTRLRAVPAGGMMAFFFLFTTASRTALGPTRPPIQLVLAAFSPGVERPRHVSDHSTPSRDDVKNAWSYTSTPPIRVHGVVLIKHRDFTFKKFSLCPCIQETPHLIPHYFWCGRNANKMAQITSECESVPHDFSIAVEVRLLRCTDLTDYASSALLRNVTETQLHWPMPRLSFETATSA
jgi:hypothetical protein